MSNAGKNLTLLASVLLMSLLLCEVAFRLINGVSPFALTNFRETRAIRVTFNDMSRYDALLGVVHRDNLDYGGFRTAEYGIRRHSPEQTRARKGAILVSGASFTAGSDVVDADTWAAQLEQILGRPVENAAVGGWGADQVILRAEQLIPILEPEIIVLDLMDATIQWVSYSVFGMPKPYFSIEKGKLIAHNAPVPRSLPHDLLPRAGWLKSIGSYSLIVDRVMSTIDANAWYGQPGTVVRIQNDPINVTCALLQRLKLKTEERNIRVALLSLFNAPQIMSTEGPPPSVISVEKCAGAMGFQLISAFDRMHALYREDPKSIEALYFKQNDLFTHFTPRGNREVAMLVAEALKAQPAKGVASDYQLAPFVPGDGRNLFVGSGALEDLVSESQGVLLRKLVRGASEAQGFQMSASGVKGEHFIALKPVSVDGGPITLSLEVRAEESEAFRVELFVGSGSAVFAEFDLGRAYSTTIPVGELEFRNLDAQVLPLRGGWYGISLTVTLPAADEVRILLRLRDRAGVSNFASNGEAMLLRRLQLERGQSASPYRTSSSELGDAINLHPTSGQQQRPSRIDAR
jgi:hypothetical protein